MNLLVVIYVPAPDDSIRGVVYKAYTDETDHNFQAPLMKKNLNIPMANARRLGSSKHLVIAFAGHKLPATIRFRCFTLEVHPSGTDLRPASTAGSLGTAQMCARSPALEYENAEDAVENIPHRH
ncbi:hypothetical protein MRX96_054899 [Rhipicephalus microplus]